LFRRKEYSEGSNEDQGDQILRFVRLKRNQVQFVNLPEVGKNV
jgi:hypothetical protein